MPFKLNTNVAGTTSKWIIFDGFEQTFKADVDLEPSPTFMMGNFCENN